MVTRITSARCPTCSPAGRSPSSERPSRSASSVIDCAVRFDRRVALVGRSLITHVAVARDLGLLHVPEGTLVDLAQARALPREQVVLLTAGSQAEATSALVRIAMNAHKQVSLDP